MYANVNSILHGNVFSEFSRRTSVTGFPSKVSVVGPMPPRSSSCSRDAIMKIIGKERKPKHLAYFIGLMIAR